MKNFEKIISIFLNRIDGLQSYVENILSQFVEDEKDNKLLIPFILASNANRGEDDSRKLNQKEISDLEKKFGRKIEFEDEPLDESNSDSIDTVIYPNKKIIWKNSKEKKKSYDARKSLFDSFVKNKSHDKYREMTLEMSFVRLISEVEKFFSEIIHCYFEQSPDYLSKGEKSKVQKFSYADFNELRTGKNVLHRMVELEFINNKGIENWFDYLQKGPFKNLNLSIIEKIKPELIECYQRRNILTHDGGIVNRIYLDKYPNNHPESKPKLNSRIKLTPGYLNRAISNFEICFLIIASEIWKLSPKENQTSRGNKLWMRGFHHLENENYENTILIGDYIEKDSKINEKDKLYSRMNRYVAKKSLLGHQAIVDELSKENIGLNPMLFRMALLVISEKYDDSLPLIDDLLQNNLKTHIFEEHKNNKNQIATQIKEQKNAISKAQNKVVDAKKYELEMREQLINYEKENEEEDIRFEDRLDFNPSIAIDSLKTWPLFKFFREDQKENYEKLVKKYSKDS
jgi:hypothetical protein